MTSRHSLRHRLLAFACAATSALALLAAVSPGSLASPAKGRGPWTDFPWPSSQWPACDAPSASPGAGLPAGDEHLVVVLGDSLIRDDRARLTAAFARRGFTPVFICKGGMGLDWGREQVDALARLRLLPRCLVVNLGVNDLKGTTEANLADAVGMPVVRERLEHFAASASGIDHVLFVEPTADVSRAPGTLAAAGQFPSVWREVVDESGVGSIVPWAQRAMRHPGRIGSDGVHDTPVGAAARARLIARNVASGC